MAREKQAARVHRIYPSASAVRMARVWNTAHRTRIIVATGKRITYHGGIDRPSIKLSDLRKVLGTKIHGTVCTRRNGVNEYPEPDSRDRGQSNFLETCPVRTKQDGDAVFLFKGFCATKEKFESAEFKDSLIPGSQRFFERFVYAQDWYQYRVGFRLAASPNRAANYAIDLRSDDDTKSYLAVYKVEKASTLVRGENFDSQWFNDLGIGEDVLLADFTNLHFVGAYELYFP